MALLKAGTRLRSAVCNTELMVVGAPKEEIEITCGGAPLIAMSEEGSGTVSEDAKGGTQVGKRYVNEAGELELLCVKPGDGSLALAGEKLVLKEAKPLPSSD